MSDFDKEENQHYQGRFLSDVAAEMGTDWVSAAMDLILADSSSISTIYFLMSEDNVEYQMRQPWMKFGTDAGGWNPDTAEGLTHPRSYGTYPRILGRYVRERGVMTLEEAVRKITSAVATRLSIQDRGVLREGLFADITVFDLDTIIDNATYEDPHQVSTGIQHVFVNGTAVLNNGSHTGAKPGRAVRGPGYTN